MRSDRDRGAPARHRRRRFGGPRDRGSAVVEFAAAFPAVVLLLLAGLAALVVVTAKVRCADAAGLAARAAARGEPDSAASEAAPAGATISVQRDGDLVRVSVRYTFQPLGLVLHERSVARFEPGEGLS
ncbi:TadE family type IV pilus minor pilin [Dactylosporangium sp. AC04546]|uniref:TadE family type IV pilus minor pilin n=1 Tax=Dactylosporangium sp. AC04546 TaxID=2862460 RepID=UPI001EDE05A0|nr:TadE family type IV pilus minor pilin [Dactylosporangium sp. AC04546]WVK84092.1 TadE family type IV pilus minor pilin [Dactylosporangium sp. AC04546]